PAGVMIEVSRDQRDIDIAALADGLAIVQRLQNREAARVLLYLAREGVEIARPGVRADLLPMRKRFAGSADSSVYVLCVALGDAGELLAGRGIVGVEIFAGHGRYPLAADEVPEAALVTVEPGECLLGVLEGCSVFHGGEFGGDAHQLSVAGCQSASRTLRM